MADRGEKSPQPSESVVFFFFTVLSSMRFRMARVCTVLSAACMSTVVGACLWDVERGLR